MYFGTPMINKKKGFTLLEMLVVVLVIGILAAIAIPMYQKSVERSRATEAFEILSQIRNRQEERNLLGRTKEDRAYATTFSDLGEVVANYPSPVANALSTDTFTYYLNQ
ncbi:MAG: prepilin-type N-terminal cleavage/methylation domain-containing protein, partial [Elusimicrobia bacterium]|nr:prepilin-type N-terminal cleavage/methylation domain-containing protein [Elusimicrobiota bacterium]